MLNCVLCFVQSAGTENCYQYFSKEAGHVSRDGNARTVHPQFSIFHDELQPSATKLSTADQGTAITDHEEMELHPSVTAAFVQRETISDQHEVFNDIDNTG